MRLSSPDHTNYPPPSPKMVRIQNHHPLLSQIRGARNYSEQAAALRALKDEVVGHVQQKEAWVERGIPEIIVKILQNARSPAKLNGKEARGHGGGHLRSLTDEEIVRLQSLQLLASFAKGGQTSPSSETRRKVGLTKLFSCA